MKILLPLINSITMNNKISNTPFILVVIALLITTTTFAQTKVGCEENPYIEVNGSAELEVIPDEIYINIIIREKYINKEKVTIAKQEEKLKTFLKDINIDINNLYLSDANADYVKVKLWSKDVLTKKDYTLKVVSANSVGQVFQQLEKLEINDAYIAKVSHSQFDSLRKEVKILAIKAAKNKADYLLSAIGEQTGKPLIVQERENVTYSNSNANYTSNRNELMTVYLPKSTGEDKIEELQFEKIKLNALIYVKFSIK